MWNATLEPGAEANVTLAFGAGPLLDSWLLVFQFDVQGNIIGRLQESSHEVEWTWAEGRHRETVRLTETGNPVLTVRNDDNQTSTVRFYFDQTCECFGKNIPEESGSILFNVDAEKGQLVRFDMTLVPVRGTFDTPRGTFEGKFAAKAHWINPSPDGRTYETIHTWSWEGETPQRDVCRTMMRFHGCIEVVFMAETDGMQFILVEAEHNMPEWSTQVLPSVSLEDGARNIPSLGPVMAWISMAALATLQRDE